MCKCGLVNSFQEKIINRKTICHSHRKFITSEFISVQYIRIREINKSENVLKLMSSKN